MHLYNPNLPPPPIDKYPAKAHARRVAEYLSEKYEAGEKDVIYLEGQKTKMVEVRIF